MIVLPDLVFLCVIDLSVKSLAILVGDSGLVVLIIVFGVVVEFESDSFSILPLSSLSCNISNNKNLILLREFLPWVIFAFRSSAYWRTPIRNRD